MNKNLELLLRLEELLLLQQAASEHGGDATELEQRIIRLRRQVPGSILSRFDALSRQYANTVVPVQDGVCQGCRNEVPDRLAAESRTISKTLQCGSCGRFLVPVEHLPDYIG